MQPVIWGTAGHIDHGKTALIQALTGTNTDRLEEEKRRGLTIDIGFAFLSREISFIDVPGHERFVKNMVTGVSTIDAALLVVAADDGVMPQTREHLDILTLLGIQAGVIVLTKVDLVDPEWIDLVEDTIRETVRGTFLEDSEIFRTSAPAGQGIEQLREQITAISGTIPRRVDRGIPRMPVDRVFTVKGFGTVVTGSVLSGVFHEGDNVRILPGDLPAKIRGIQRHNQPEKTASMSDRAALNLSNIEVGEISRGAQLTVPGMLDVTREFYASVRVLPGAEKPLVRDQRVRIHFGTTEILGKCLILGHNTIQPGESGIVRFVTEEQAVLAFQDRIIIRFYSPMYTIGGGLVLHTQKITHLPKTQLVQMLTQLKSSELSELVVAVTGITGKILLTLNDYSQQLFYRQEQLEPVIARLVNDGKLRSFTAEGLTYYTRRDIFEENQKHLLKRVEKYHLNHPKEPGIPRSQLLQELHWDETALNLFIRELSAENSLSDQGPVIKLPTHEITLTDAEGLLMQDMTEYIQRQGFEPPSISDLTAHFSREEKVLRELLKVLQYQKVVERLPGDLYFYTGHLDNLKRLIAAHFADHEELTVGEFKELVGASRKYTIPLLEYADQQGWTRRVGEVRIKNRI